MVILKFKKWIKLLKISAKLLNLEILGRGYDRGWMCYYQVEINYVLISAYHKLIILERLLIRAQILK